jgi:hypothetical protein
MVDRMKVVMVDQVVVHHIFQFFLQEQELLIKAEMVELVMTTLELHQAVVVVLER